MKKQSKFAFSLIELSIVILVIGILVIGITKGSRVITEAKLKSALSLTQGSPVNSTSGLSFWLDATDNNNIAIGSSGSGVYKKPGNNDRVTEWRDRSPLNDSKIIFTATSDAKRPTYLSTAFNSLPAIRFDGATSSLSSTTSINSSLLGIDGQGTIFIVAKPISLVASSANTVFVFQSASSNRIGVSFNTSIARFEYGNATSGASSGVLLGTTNIMGVKYLMTFDKKSTTQTTYLNGNSEATKSNSDVLTPFSANAFIGSYTANNHYSNADISELIIFNRSLTNYEREAIEDYLGKKWGLKVN